MNRSTHRFNVLTPAVQRMRTHLLIALAAAFLPISAAMACMILPTEEYVMDSKMVYVGKIVEVQSQLDASMFDAYVDEEGAYEDDEAPEDYVEVYYIIEPVSVLRTSNHAKPERIRIYGFMDTKKSFEANLPNLMNEEIGREVVLIVNQSKRTNEEWTTMRDIDSLPEITMILDEMNAVDAVLAELDVH